MPLVLHDQLTGRSIVKCAETFDGIEPVKPGWHALFGARLWLRGGEPSRARTLAMRARNYFRGRPHERYGDSNAILLYVEATPVDTDDLEEPMNELISMAQSIRARRIEALARLMRARRHST